MVVRAQRPEDPEDKAAVRRVITEAFGPEGAKVADLAEALAASMNNRLSFVAEHAEQEGQATQQGQATQLGQAGQEGQAAQLGQAGQEGQATQLGQAGQEGQAAQQGQAGQEGQVVGHVQLSRSWVDAPARLVDVLVLSPLGVLPRYQSKGIGKQLVARSIAEAEKAGAPMLFLEGSPAYYSRLGFEPGGRHGFTRPSVRIPEAAFQVVLLPAYEPWMTGALVYNEQFWAHDCVGLR